MATVRIQVRRGTASQWTSTNPILAAGEMGVETDTRLFKFGNGSATWTALSYANNSDVAIGEISQDAINTALTMGAGLSKTYNDGANTITINVDSNVVALKSYVDGQITSLTNTVDADYIAASDRGAALGVASLNAQGKVPTSEIDATVFSTRAYAEYLQAQDLTALGSHENDTTNIHGIPDTTLLATKAYADSSASTAATSAVSAQNTSMTEYVNTKVSTHEADTTSVHGIADTSVLATSTTVATAKSEAIAAAASAAGTALTAHETDTTNVHGISDTAALATKSYVDTADALKANLASPTFTGTVAGITKSMVGLGNVDNTSDSAKPISTAAQTALDLKAPLASPTFTGTVSGITKSMVGLGSVDNTTDAGKPVSTATQTALDLKANLASPTLTGTPLAPTAATGTNTTQVATTGFVQQELSILTTGAPALLNTLDELAAALGDDANYASTVTTALSTKAPLASPTFTGTVSGITKSMVGLGSVDNTADASKPVSTAQQTALDLKSNLASPTFTGTVTAPAITATALITASASGVAFTDGTQTKVGVPSITTIAQKTASYTLAALTERDSMIEMNSASATTLTVPTNATIAYPVGTSIDVLRVGAGAVDVAAAAGVTINATPGLKLRAQWSSATLVKRATDTWVLLGDLSA